MKRTLKRMLCLPLLFCLAAGLFAQEVVELKMAQSNKIVVKFMFRNGSICDPAGKEGLTYAHGKKIFFRKLNPV